MCGNLMCGVVWMGSRVGLALLKLPNNDTVTRQFKFDRTILQDLYSEIINLNTNFEYNFENWFYQGGQGG